MIDPSSTVELIEELQRHAKALVAGIDPNDIAAALMTIAQELRLGMEHESAEVSGATFVRGILYATTQYEADSDPISLVDVTGAFWHMLRGLSEHPKCTHAELARALAISAKLYEHARRCCPPNAPSHPDLQRWAREALQPE